MDFNTIENLLKTGADKTERINMIMSESQDQAQGIIDGPTGTDCNADYWERGYGLADTVIALYDMIAGRDTVGYINLLDTLIVSAGVASVDGLLVVSGNVQSSADVTSIDDILSGNDVIANTGVGMLKGGRLDISDAGINTGLWFEEIYFAGKLGLNNKSIYFDNGNVVIDMPYTDAEYQSFTEGGNFRILGDTTIFDINQRGAIGIGGHIIDDVASHASLTIQRSDAFGSAGDTFLRATTIASDDRSSSGLLIEDENIHSTLSTLTTGIKLSTSRTVNGLIEFIFDGVTGCQFNALGIGVQNVQATVGSFSTLQASTIESLGLLETLDLFVGFNGSIQNGEILAGNLDLTSHAVINDYLNVNHSTTRQVRLETTLDTLMKITDGTYNVDFGFIDSGDIGSLYLLGNINKLVLQAGPTVGSALGEFLIDIVSANPSAGGILFTHVPDVYQLFIDEEGIPKSGKVTGYPTGYGPKDTGYVRIPYNTSAIDMCLQASVNAAAAVVSEVASGAICMLNDLACGPTVVACNGSADWFPLASFRMRVHEQDAGETVYQLESEVTMIHVTRTATGAAFVTLPDVQARAGRIIMIKDAAFNASVYNITISSAGAGLIEGGSTIIISTDGSAVSFYSDGTDWFIF